MKKVIIEIEEELHKQLKINCCTNGVTIKKYVSNLVINDLEQKKEQTQ